MARTSWETIVRYDGPILADHKMDVEDIAPAMMALAELCKRANAIANGEHVSVKVLVDLDVEQHCAAFGIEIVQTVFDTLRHFFDDENTKTGRELLEFIGITGAAVGTITAVPLGLFALLKKINGRKPESTSPVLGGPVSTAGRDLVQINVGGDAYITYSTTAKLLADPVAMKSAKDVLKPTRKEGYERVEFESEGGVKEVLTKQDAILIDAIPVMDSGAEPGSIIPESRIRARVKIRKAVYDGNGKWTIQYDKSRDMTLGDEAWLADFQANKVQAPPGSFLDVEISVSAIHLDKTGKPLDEPNFTIIKVHAVYPPESYTDLFAPARTTRSPVHIWPPMPMKWRGAKITAESPMATSSVPSPVWQWATRLAGFGRDTGNDRRYDGR